MAGASEIRVKLVSNSLLYRFLVNVSLNTELPTFGPCL